MKLMFFYDGIEDSKALWRLRFTPDAAGTWTWHSDCAALANDNTLQGQAECAAANPEAGGAIYRHPSYPKFLARQSGDAFVPVGLEMDALFMLEETASEGYPSVGQVLDLLSDAGINYLFVQVYYNYSSWFTQPNGKPPRVAPVAQTPWASADQMELNLAYFRKIDRVLSLLEARGMVAHVMIYVGNKHVDWPAQESTADDIYWRYCMARFGASNAVVWDVSKEAGSYGVGRPYIINRLELMNAMNGHQRLIGAHSGVSKADQYRSNLCPTELCSILPAQMHYWSNEISDFYPYEQQVPLFYGSMRELVQAEENQQRPVGNIEFLYEMGSVCGCSAGTCCGGCANTTMRAVQMRQVMWESYFALSYGVWYNSDNAWDVITQASMSTIWTRQLATLNTFWHEVGPMWRFAVCTDGQEPLNTTGPVRCLIDTKRPCIMILSLGSQARLTWPSEGGPFPGLTIDIQQSFWLDPSTVPLAKRPLAKPSLIEQTPPSSIQNEAVLFLTFVPPRTTTPTTTTTATITTTTTTSITD